MATELDQTYCGWPHQERLGQEDSQDAAITQMLDQGSISFGRFAVESLAWEKRSVFTHNRCQEELEKLKAPGLVAQKKAYFEAYYKKIRDLKTLQGNEQTETELVVEYGGDDNSSCQNGEVEDEDFKQDTVRNGVTIIATDCLREHAAEAGCEYSGPKLVVTCPNYSTSTSEGDTSFVHGRLNDDMFPEHAGICTASTASFKEIDMVKNSIDPLQSQLNSTQLSLIPKIDPLQYGKLYPQSTIPYDDLQNADTEDVEFKKNSGCSLQMVRMSNESTLLDSPRRIEEIELLKSLCSDEDDDGDDGWNIKQVQYTKESTNDRTGADLNRPDSLMLRNISKFPPGYNHVTGEVKALFHKQINHSVEPRIKASVSFTRKSMNTQYKSTSEAVKASKIPKHLLLKASAANKKNASTCNAPSGRLPSKNKSTSDSSYRTHNTQSSLTVVKEVKSAHLSNARCKRAPKEKKSTSVSSSRQHKESPTNVTVSLSFSSAAQRQSTASHGTRESGPQSSSPNMSNGSTHASKPLSMKSTPVMRHAARGVKNAGLESRSQHGEILKTLSVLSSHIAVPKARDGFLRRSETRSINLPAVSKHSLTSKAGSELKEVRPKEGKINARPRFFGGTSEIAAAPPGRTNKTNIGKEQLGHWARGVCRLH